MHDLVTFTASDNRGIAELLNGKEFKGRAVIADDRNADRPLKDGGSFSMPMSPSSYMTSPGASFSHGAMMPSCDVLTAAYPQPSVPTTTYGYYGSGVEAQQPFYGYQAAPDRQPALYNQSASYAVQPIQPYSEYYPPPPPPPPHSMAVLTNQMADMTMGGAAATSGGVVFTEQRGIHIRELSRRASEEQVRRMICEAAGREASMINLVEVPLDKEGSPRGYALAHFRSADLARRMVVRLHGVDFKGRKLQVRLLKEGEAVGVGGCGAVATPPTRGHGHGHRSGRHHSSSVRRDEGRRSDRRDRERERGPDRGDKKASSSSSTLSSASKGMPLVVGGGFSGAEASSLCSSPSPSSKGKDKDKGKEKHGGKKSAVVIADGSSRRADKN
ncbi:hypothetical protein INS49_006490 [Diaporthe citri]|uniref:uncharacterized protein n=1 Tax=Diaporthe citri TaxID=83186 RepID=UPI001C8249C7|nr:uncharacterized protein INS49_006490 [Diaporthe citri]KAG6364886.1 hypothetical protein INS49_006490 [Diaporthe citri]